MQIKKPLFIIILAAVFIAAGAYYVVAQTVSDSYDNDSKIADSWNISTSTSGQISLAAKECDAFTWYCTASTTCANYLGDGDYIIVAQGDAPSSEEWKTTDSACDQPHCSINGGQDGDNLKADNTLDFSAYPAREYCQSIGARLPTIDELECIYDNSGGRGANVFGNFGAGVYWSSTESSESIARGVGFSSGSSDSYDKSNVYYVRCVFGW